MDSLSLHLTPGLDLAKVKLNVTLHGCLQHGCGANVRLRLLAPIGSFERAKLAATSPTGPLESDRRVVQSSFYLLFPNAFSPLPKWIHGIKVLGNVSSDVAG